MTDGRAGRTTKRRPRTVASLLDAAETVFARRGIDGASIAELCAAADLTRGAFYSNFTDKHELFFALSERRRGQMAETMSAGLDAVTAAEDPIAELAARVVTFGDAAYRPWFLITMEFTLLGARDERARDRLARDRATTRELVAEMVEVALTAAGREPIDSATEVAWALTASFLGWQAQIAAEPDVDTAFRARRAQALLVEQLLGMSRPVTGAEPERTGPPADRVGVRSAGD